MAEYTDREKFIPFRKTELVDLLCAAGDLPDDGQSKFRAFARVLESLYHFEFHEKLEDLKHHYYPFNPDRDTQTRKTWDAAALTTHEEALVERLSDVLANANYEVVTDAELQHALDEESLFRISLAVDFGDFSRLMLFRRGDVTHQAEIKVFPRRKKTIDVPTFERVAFLVRFKDRAYFEGKRKNKKKPLDLPYEPGSVVLKLFKNVPKADLEMLFPNTQVRMTWRDRAMLLVPGVIGGVGVVLKSAASLALAAALVWAIAQQKLTTGADLTTVDLKPEQMAVILGALTALVGLGMFAVKQWLNFKNRKILFMKTLADSLYFKNLDNNEGVLHHVVDHAEEEECKEALLAFYFLAKHSDGLTEADLDDAIEQWLEDKHDVKIDFEVDDGLRKLQKLGLSEVSGKNAAGVDIHRVPDLTEACRRLDEIWDNIFQYNNDAGAGEG